MENEIASDGYIYFRTKETELVHLTREFSLEKNAPVWPPHRNGAVVLVRTSEFGLDMDFTVCCKGTMSSPIMRRFARNQILF